MARAARAASDKGADTPIQSDTAFWATLQNAARLHRVCSTTLAERLQGTGRRGLPVTADLLYTAAANLALEMGAPAVQFSSGPDPAVLAAEVAASRHVRLPGAPRGSARNRRRGHGGVSGGGFGS